MFKKKKRKMYIQLCMFMNERDMNHQNLKLSHIRLLQQVSGIGVGCIAWCKKYFDYDNSSELEDCEYTDIYFKKGFNKLYGTDSLGERRRKSVEWQNKKYGRVANIMVLQIGGYC